MTAIFPNSNIPFYYYTPNTPQQPIQQHPMQHMQHQHPMQHHNHNHGHNNQIPPTPQPQFSSQLLNKNMYGQSGPVALFPQTSYQPQYTFATTPCLNYSQQIAHPQIHSPQLIMDQHSSPCLSVGELSPSTPLSSSTGYNLQTINVPMSINGLPQSPINTNTNSFKRSFSTMEDLHSSSTSSEEMEDYSSDKHCSDKESNDCDDDADSYSGEYEEDQEAIRAYIQPLIHLIFKTPGINLSILKILSECSKEEITVKQMLLNIKNLCLEFNLDNSIHNALINSFVKIDGDTKMVKYLKENGITDHELEFTKDLPLTSNSTEITKKKRERKRESISRGIRSPPNKWTKEESQNLIKLVTENGDKQWKKIATKLGGGKTGAQCAQHWKRVLSPEIKKGSWDEAEEELLFTLVDKHGQSWKNVAIEIKTRTDIQCRYQYFKAIMSRQTEWNQLEDDILLKKVKQMTSNNEKISFQQVSKHLARAKTTKIPRTALECKSRYSQLNNNKSNSNSNSTSQLDNNQQSFIQDNNNLYFSKSNDHQYNQQQSFNQQQSLYQNNNNSPLIL